MTFDPSLVGSILVDEDRRWTTADTCLYALGIGAGAVDPTAELDFTTENTAGRDHRVHPSFSVVLSSVPGASALDRIGDYDKEMLVHGEQSFAIEEPIPPEGAARVTTHLSGIHHKGSGALVVTETFGRREQGAGESSLLFRTRASYFIRGAHGLDPQPQPQGQPDWVAPERPADTIVTQPTRADQPLLYRLSGDGNPLHSDPAVARRAGFPRPILQGLCTFGFAARAIGTAAGRNDAGRVRQMAGRFTRPVLPGLPLKTRMWVEAEEILFQTLQDNTIVIDRGRASLDTTGDTVGAA
ncbi:MaoC/PaaZ C-terminal domain-containing protein [Ornithinimicrobium faecis]|uniref:MaoC/PaaZ C-terminal domain-containing protein n=1 Tax=Ornithinimicrobium faecis TaxID=2934158 RepID=UPI002117A3FC|nr:MaoC/PaaZ C-terminal domain-containing protein [Ornithinimicrobium sp. HY1745]